VAEDCTLGAVFGPISNQAQSGHAISPTQDGNCPRLRADEEADSTRSAARARIGRGPISVVIEPVVQSDRFGRASLDAQAAAFAFISIDPKQASVLFFDTHL